VVVDGALASNLDGVNTPSNVFPADADRTFDFAGVINNASPVDIQMYVETTQLKTTACSPSKTGRIFREEY
jgi:hypothetical protein